MLGLLAAFGEGDGLTDLDRDVGGRHRVAAEHRVDGRGGVGVARLGLGVRLGRVEAVVERAVVGDGEILLGVDDEDLALALDVHPLADQLQIVNQQGHSELVGLGFQRRGVGRVAGIDHVEEDAAVLVGFLQTAEFGGGGARQRRAVGLRHDHDGRRIFEIIELVRHPIGVGELEVDGLLQPCGLLGVGRGDDRSHPDRRHDRGGGRRSHPNSPHSSSPS